MKKYYELMQSPIGEICILTTEDSLREVLLFKEEWNNYLVAHSEYIRGGKISEVVIKQLEEYFRGERKNFNIPLSLEGTSYRLRVWEAVSKVPYGEVVSYQEIANEIQNPLSVRAIGQANKANKIPIIIPCHRVIGKSGKLVGYAGNRVETKLYLLNLEKNYINSKKIYL